MQSERKTRRKSTPRRSQSAPCMIVNGVRFEEDGRVSGAPKRVNDSLRAQVRARSSSSDPLVNISDECNFDGIIIGSNMTVRNKQVFTAPGTRYAHRSSTGVFSLHRAGEMSTFQIPPFTPVFGACGTSTQPRAPANPGAAAPSIASTNGASSASQVTDPVVAQKSPTKDSPKPSPK
jgi:hypothetical protein